MNARQKWAISELGATISVGSMISENKIKTLTSMATPQVISSFTDDAMARNIHVDSKVGPI